MRVLYVTNNFPNKFRPVFGIFVKEQIESVASLGIDIEVFFINAKDLGKWEYLKAAVRLRKKLAKNRYDIIHCHHSFSGLSLLLSGKIRAAKTVLSYQADPVNEGGSLLFRLLHPFFSRILFKNRSVFLKYRGTYSLPNGVNTGFFTPLDRKLSQEKLSLDPDKTYILFVSSNSIRKQKRIDRFEEIITLLKKKLPAINITPLILTNTERSVMPYYICTSSLHILTSDFEGSPNSVKECLACNVPVVSTPVGNVKEMIGDVEGCYVSESFDSEEIAGLAEKAIMYGSVDGRKALEEKQLSQESVAKKLVAIYESLVTL